MSREDGLLDNGSKFIVTCKSCKKQYIQYQEDQIPGFRDRDYDYCPYCRHENGSSMEVEFMNRRLED